MRTAVLPATGRGAVETAAEVLRSGGLVAFPTDTVYGVGAHALLPHAVDSIYTAKGRPPTVAIPLLLPDAGSMHRVCSRIPVAAWMLAQRFWPGGLTLVLERSALVPDAVTAGGSTVAVRVPDHPLPRELCRYLDAPLAATSANRHGQSAPVSAHEVEVALGGRIDLLLDGGLCPGGIASTVLDLTVEPPAILRAGPITAEELATVLCTLA